MHATLIIITNISLPYVYILDKGESLNKHKTNTVSPC